MNIEKTHTPFFTQTLFNWKSRIKSLSVGHCVFDPKYVYVFTYVRTYLFTHSLTYLFLRYSFTLLHLDSIIVTFLFINLYVERLLPAYRSKRMFLFS